MNKILFIQPYDLPKISSGRSRKAAYLSRTGFEVGYQVPRQYGFSLLDLNIEVHQNKTIVDSIKEKILAEKPDVVFVTFPSFAQGLQVASVIRAIRNVSHDCKIVLGGGAISLVKDAPLKWWSKYKISGCYNGFGIEIPDIIRYLLKGEKHDIPKGFYTGENDTSCKGNSKLIDGYSAEAFYSVNGRVIFSEYLETFRSAGLRPIGLIEMMRGCQYDCNFCAINKDRLGCHSRLAETVAGEAEFLASHGIKHIHLIDPTFGLDKEKALTLLALLASISKKHSVTFETVTRADMISEDFAQAMKEAGVVRCDIGMETMSDEKLKAVEKRTDAKMIWQAIDCLASQNIQVKLFHITFPEKISVETIVFLLTLTDRGVDFLVQSSYLRALPTPESIPSFLKQDQLVFVPNKDTMPELMERIIVNLCFKSMDTNYNESGLRETVRVAIKKGLPLESLFSQPIVSEDGFRLNLLPRFNGHHYIYVHRRGQPFSLGMCRI